MNDKDNYTAESIEIIENLEAVRKRPGMYIGDTEANGYQHLFKEILDNAIDEYLVGHCKTIIVTLLSDNSLSVEDDGRGIPVDIHPKTKKPAVETIFTTLHSGGKFGGDNAGYTISGGLHGVGSSVVNALSEFLDVMIWKGGKEYLIKFIKGGTVKDKLKEIGSTSKTGTKVHFKPDKNIFGNIFFNNQKIIERLKEVAYLNEGLKIIYINEKNNFQYEYIFSDGIKKYIEDLIVNHKVICKIIDLSSKTDDIIVKIAFQYTSDESEHIISFVNNIPTHEGGSHEKAFTQMLTKALNDFAEKNNLLENKSSPFEEEDVKEGLFAIVSIYLVEKYLQFEGQTKSRLASPFAKTYCEKLVYEQLILYFTKNKDEGNEIVKRVLLAKAARDAAKKAREYTRDISKNSKKSFVGKLVVAQSSNRLEKELFLVEGDSAGGSAKMGRDRKTQAILPLKGKVINTQKANIKAILANEELATIIYAIGGGIGRDFNIDDINYDKIIIMTDADTDGAHIQILLLTFFYRFMQTLMREGKIYIALPPLFKVTIKNPKTIHYLWTIKELNELKENNKNIEIQRYKGLGEMNYEQLWDTTMNPETRTLIQVKINNIDEINKLVETLMGQDSEQRRIWIEENIEFSLEDSIESTKVYLESTE